MTVPSDPGLRAAYDDWHTPIAADEAVESPWHRLVRRHLDPARDLAGKRALEIGCGRGSLARWLVARDTPPARLVAADFSSTAVRKARGASGAAAIDWQICDIQALPFATASFDTVISCETVEHLPDPARAVAELARVLKPGGRLLLTTPNYLNAMGLYRVYLRLTGRRYTETGQPLNRFTLLPRTRGWMRRAGLRVERAESAGHYLPYPGRPPVELSVGPRLAAWLSWFGLHSFVSARKPGR
jgi:ubiquinone/menaquinone biosynthesis C-methylase UbiE